MCSEVGSTQKGARGKPGTARHSPVPAAGTSSAHTHAAGCKGTSLAPAALSQLPAAVSHESMSELHVGKHIRAQFQTLPIAFCPMLSSYPSLGLGLLER